MKLTRVSLEESLWQSWGQLVVNAKDGDTYIYQGGRMGQFISKRCQLAMSIWTLLGRNLDSNSGTNV